MRGRPARWRLVHARRAALGWVRADLLDALHPAGWGVAEQARFAYALHAVAPPGYLGSLEQVLALPPGAIEAGDFSAVVGPLPGGELPAEATGGRPPRWRLVRARIALLGWTQRDLLTALHPEGHTAGQQSRLTRALAGRADRPAWRPGADYLETLTQALHLPVGSLQRLDFGAAIRSL